MMMMMILLMMNPDDLINTIDNSMEFGHNL